MAKEWPKIDPPLLNVSLPLDELAGRAHLIGELVELFDDLIAAMLTMPLSEQLDKIETAFANVMADKDDTPIKEADYIITVKMGALLRTVSNRWSKVEIAASDAYAKQHMSDGG